LSSENDAEIATQRILEALREEFIFDGRPIPLAASIGISCYPTDCKDIETLMKSADTAMYGAKEKSGNCYCFYHEHSGLDGASLIALKKSISSVAARNELVVHYQPLVDLETSKVVGLEALCRWNHPELGLLQPSHFISLAEETGAIIPMGEWILRTACTQNRAWQDAGCCRVPIAVNISVRQFTQSDIVEKICAIVEETGLDPEYLELELTESTVMVDIEQCRKKFEALFNHGIHIVIDDFGSGYSSLARLKSLPIHAIKIDRFFLQNIVDDRRDAAIVMAIVALANSLQIKVIAEGIETAEQLEYLKTLRWDLPSDLHCTSGQGYFFSKPLPAEQAREFLGQDTRVTIRPKERS
jgi:EAL domain-containing protein (putative c-di-GMP-specific phosphodiesterase class I)